MATTGDEIDTRQWPLFDLLAGADASVSDDWSLTGSLGYKTNPNVFNVFLRADVSKLDFDTNVSVETLGDVGTANVDPLVVGLLVGYQF